MGGWLSLEIKRTALRRHRVASLQLETALLSASWEGGVSAGLIPQSLAVC